MLEIAGLQTDIAWEDPARNFESARQLAARAAADGARLIVLPEMFATGFSMRAEAVSAFAIETRQALSEIAAELDVWLLGGYAEPGDHAEPRASRPRNACSIFGPDGDECLRYHKMHPFSFAEEHVHYAAGDDIHSLVIEGLRVTPLICYDLRFPEPFRAAAHTTDLFVVIANWPATRREHWLALLKARAIENQAYVLGVNRVGEGNGLAYSGDSAMFTPLGDGHFCPQNQQGLLRGRVDPQEVGRARANFSFLADRRPWTDFEPPISDG